MSAIRLDKGDALLVIDNILPGGSPGVPGGHEVIAPINHLLALYAAHGLPVFASRNWHRADSRFASLSAELAFPDDTIVVSTATGSARDAGSAFHGTPLARQLNERGIKRIAVCGLAADCCLLGTVTDAVGEGFDTLVVPEAMRAVDVNPGDGTRAIDRMVARGAVAVRLGGTGMTALSVG